MQEEPAIVGTLCCVVFLGNSPQHGLWSWILGIGAAVALLIYRILPEEAFLAKQEVLDAKLGISIVVVVVSVYAAVLGALKRYPRFTKILHWQYKHRLELEYVKGLLDAGNRVGSINRYRTACAEGRVVWKGTRSKEGPSMRTFLLTITDSWKHSLDFPLSLAREVQSKFSGRLYGGTDCFFYPTRLLVAFTGSCVFVSLLAYKVDELIRSLQDSFYSWEGKALDLAYRALQSVQAAFAAYFHFSEPLTNQSPSVVATIAVKDSIQGFFEEGLDALVFSMYFGLAVALVVFLYGWFSTFNNFRQHTLSVRRGDYIAAGFPSRDYTKVSLVSATAYAGQQVLASPMHPRAKHSGSVVASGGQHVGYLHPLPGRRFHNRHVLSLGTCLEACLVCSCTRQEFATDQVRYGSFRTQKWDLLTIIIPGVIVGVLRSVRKRNDPNLCSCRHVHRADSWR
jgi:hypothetical protein